TIVRRPTPCLRSIARADIPARTSRRIAAYSSTFDAGGMRTLLGPQAHLPSHCKPSGAVRTHEQQLPQDRGAVRTHEQLQSVPTTRTTQPAIQIPAAVIDDPGRGAGRG